MYESKYKTTSWKCTGWIKAYFFAAGNCSNKDEDGDIFLRTFFFFFGIVWNFKDSMLSPTCNALVVGAKVERFKSFQARSQKNKDTTERSFPFSTSGRPILMKLFYTILNTKFHRMKWKFFPAWGKFLTNYLSAFTARQTNRKTFTLLQPNSGA